MLHDLLSGRRDELVDRCRAKVTLRLAPKPTPAELEHGIPLFLDQLIRTLQVEQTTNPLQSRTISGESDGAPALSEISASAALHGSELLRQGYSVDQVVHDYGDLCQAVTELAFEHKVPIAVDEFRTLNRCLDNAIADAVTEFAYQRDLGLAHVVARAHTERLGNLAHEMRNFIHTATLAVSALKTGNVGLKGATGSVLDRSLISMRDLIDRSLAEVRVEAGIAPRQELLGVAGFIAEVKSAVSLEAQSRGCGFVVSDVEPSLAVDADREMLFSALNNLLQNAFKFTARRSDVTLTAYGAADRIRIDVADHCGGLQTGEAEAMFLPFVQKAADKTGLGLGLSICRRSVEANGGLLSVRNAPGTGCVFTIDLPRHSLPGPGA
ncbi:MAG TPA: HAMP domain-containing sensor histidine kinase [Casimicrobiaceae bacterium]|jgi:hypothetical protein